MRITPLHTGSEYENAIRFINQLILIDRIGKLSDSDIVEAQQLEQRVLKYEQENTNRYFTIPYFTV